MDFIHCDDFETFLHDVAFGTQNEIAHALYEKALAMVQPRPINLTEDEILLEDMDDCWDSEWLNPLTGIPHYTAANVILSGTDLNSSLMEQVYCGEPPKVVLTWGYDDADAGGDADADAGGDADADASGDADGGGGDDADEQNIVEEFEITVKCTFCVKKFGDVPKCYTHTVKECRILMNIHCLACGKKGHTTSYCTNSTNSSESNKKNKDSSTIIKCMFCVKKFGDVSKCYTHNVKECRVLKNTTCMNCGQKGHTTSYCESQYHTQKVCTNSMSIMDKAGGIAMK